MRNRPASRHRRRPIVVTTATLRLGIVFLLLLCAAGASANGVAASGCNSLGTSINLAPAAEENAVGTTHSVTATVTELCQPKSGVTVSFTVTGANPQTGSAVTNGSGEATLSYKGKKAGTDNITSSFKTLGTTETSNEVTKVWTTPTVKSTKSCNSVTYTFSGFPNAPNNTVQEWVQVDGKVVYKGTFIFNGPSGSNTVSVSVPPGHHAITANAKWNTNGVTGEKDMPRPGGITCHVFVGYADSSHFEQNAHPTPWQGDPGVIFEGCGYGGTDTCPMSEGEDVYDAGAIRIDAPAQEGVTVSGASVQVGPCSYAPWPGLNVTVPAGGILILTETGKQKCTATSTAEQDNFDTSQSFLQSTQYQEFLQTGECSNDGYIPAITLTINGKTSTLSDTGQILNGGGIDPDLCQHVNEAHDWVQIK